MMHSTFTESTTASYCKKMQEACIGVCIGFLLFFGSVGLLVFNEGRTINRAKDLDEGRKNVMLLDLKAFTNTNLPTSFENQLIHAVGDLSTSDVLTDPIFGVSSVQAGSTTLSNEPFLKLRRSVEMYRWKETSSSKKVKNLDGSTRTDTTYSYSKVWSSDRIDSSLFKDNTVNRMNPSLPLDPLSLNANPIILGNRFLVSDSVIGYFNWYQPLGTISLDDVPDTTLKSKLTKYTTNGFYYHATGNAAYSADPVVGDARVTFDAVPADTVSIIAKVGSKNSDDTYKLDTYWTKRGTKLLLVQRGTFTSGEMFARAYSDNTTLAWILRFVGFLLMTVSILLVVQPLSTALDIIPFLGDFIQGGMTCIFPMIAFLIAAPVSLFVIALSWLAYRPISAIFSCLVLSGFLIWLWKRAKKGKGNNGRQINDLELQDYTPTNNRNQFPDSSTYKSAYAVVTPMAYAVVAPMDDGAGLNSYDGYGGYK